MEKISEFQKLDKFGKLAELNRMIKNQDISDQQTINIIQSESKIIDQKDYSNRTLLNYAIYHNKRIKLILFLIEHQKNINNQDNNNETALQIAAHHGNAELVTYLINHGADPNLKNYLGYTPLYKAMLNKITNFREIADILIKAGAKINLSDKKANTILHIATSPEDVKFLIKNDANIYMINSSGQTPLGRAIGDKYIEIVFILLKKMVEDIKKKNSGKILLQDITQLTSILRTTKDPYLNQTKTNLNLTSEDDQTLLHFAVKDGAEEIVEVLIKISENDEANLGSFNKRIEFFVPNKTTFNINIQDKDGKTPLHHAIEIGNIKIAKILLKNGAKIDIKDKNGKLPSNYITDKTREIEKFFEDTKNFREKENNIFKKIWIKMREGILSIISYFRNDFLSNISKFLKNIFSRNRKNIDKENIIIPSSSDLSKKKSDQKIATNIPKTNIL